MALKFRRGTTAQQSGSLAYGEPYVNTTLGTLLIGGPNGDIVLGTSGTGSTGNFGAISGSGLDITGNARIGGNLTLGGTITIGDATSDNVVVNADLSSSLIPNDNNAFDLGSASKRYRTIYGNTITASALEINSASWAEIVLRNTDTNGAYHIQNTAGGNFSIHNELHGLSIFRIDSGSYPQHAHLFGDLNVSKSVSVGLELIAATGSFGNIRVSNLISGSITGIGNVTVYSSSVDSRLAQLSTASGSAITRLTALEVETSNLESFTSSINTTIKTRLNAEGVISGSSQITYANISSIPSGIISGSSQLSGTTITNLTITNLTTVNQTASVLFSSGSNKFGDFSNDTHEFTGSVQISGSITTIGTATATSFNGTINATNGVVSGSSQVIGILSSLNTYTGSNDTTNTTQNTRLTALEASASTALSTNNTQATSITNLNTTTASLNTSVSNLNTFSGSALTRLTALEVETSNLESFSSSALSRLATLEGKDISVTLTGDVTGNGTITDLGNVSFATTIAADSVALGTDTTGNYVASLVAGTNITLSNNSGEGATPTIGLTNNTISGIALGSNLATLTIGTGLSGTSYNGSGAVTIANTGVTSITTNTGLSSNVGATGAVTITNSGVTSNVAGTGISVSGATGAVTITNSGVTSIVAGTGVSRDSATGAVTISIGQAVATSSNVQFNSLGIGMAASATAGRIDATNDIVAYSSSDIRFKENIKPIENALEKISKISGNTYDWKAENKAEHGYEGNDVGVIAQEIEAVLPQLVQTRENGFKAVKYDKLVALLIEGIKEQQTQIHSLTIEIEKLKEAKGL
jgi:hypothetical protein